MTLPHCLDESDPRDLIDNYLMEMKTGRKGFCKEELAYSLFDLFFAGSETTSTTLRKILLEILYLLNIFIFRWAILFLLLNQDVQSKCQKELDKISGPTSNLSDMENLQYCQATIQG